MGYRSNVTYAIQFRELSCKKKFVSLYKIHPTFNRALAECKLVEDDSSLYITASFEYVKWYESYEDVQWHMKMLDSITKDKLDGVSATFARVGEEDDDTEILMYQGDDAPDPSEIEVGTGRHAYVYNNHRPTEDYLNATRN